MGLNGYGYGYTRNLLLLRQHWCTCATSNQKAMQRQHTEQTCVHLLHSHSYIHALLSWNCSALLLAAAGYDTDVERRCARGLCYSYRLPHLWHLRAQFSLQKRVAVHVSGRKCAVMPILLTHHYSSSSESNEHQRGLPGFVYERQSPAALARIYQWKCPLKMQYLYKVLHLP
jgi:hypothetical protein